MSLFAFSLSSESPTNAHTSHAHKSSVLLQYGCCDCPRTYFFSGMNPELDTEHIYENMVGDIARSFGIPYRYDVRMRILGTTEQMTAKLAVNELRLPISVDEFTVRFSELGRQRLGNVDLLKGSSSYVGNPTVNHKSSYVSVCVFLGEIGLACKTFCFDFSTISIHNLFTLNFYFTYLQALNV